MLTFEMVGEAIEEGEVTEQKCDDGDTIVTLRHEWGAMSYEVVIDSTNETVITVSDRGTSNEQTKTEKLEKAV
jgi:hypothetical protein